MKLDASNKYWSQYTVVDAATGLTVPDVVSVDDVKHTITVWRADGTVRTTRAPRVVIIAERFTVLVNVADVFADIEQEIKDAVTA
jgi:hypothetical protein